MKKLISLLLVIVITCSLLSGCGFEIGKTEQSTTTSTTVTTTDLGDDPIQNPPVDELVFEHGDNFTEEDVEFVKGLHGMNYRMSASQFTFTFSDIIDKVQNKKGYLYHITLDLENPYYICGYLDLEIDSYHHSWEIGPIDVTIYKWYKFYSHEDIPENIGCLEHGWSFLLYDCLIHRELGSNQKYEHQCKYFTRYRGEKYLETVYENMLAFYLYSSDINIFDTKFIEEYSPRVTRYEILLDKNGEAYFKLYSNTLYYDGTIKIAEESNRKQLGEYYNTLLPLIQRLEELDYAGTDSSGDEVVYQRLGISIDAMAEFLFK